MAGCKSNLGCDRKKKKGEQKKKKQTADGPIRKKDALVPFFFSWLALHQHVLDWALAPVGARVVNRDVELDGVSTMISYRNRGFATSAPEPALRPPLFFSPFPTAHAKQNHCAPQQARTARNRPPPSPTPRSAATARLNY